MEVLLARGGGGGHSTFFLVGVCHPGFQKCVMRYNYTLLTERLRCNDWLRLRCQQDTGKDEQPIQYSWHAYSPDILMNLNPAIRSMFLAVICGKRAIDKSVVTLLNDRLNAVSMTKVQRMTQNRHDEWYAERRDLYQTLLYEAHMYCSHVFFTATNTSLH